MNTLITAAQSAGAYKLKAELIGHNVILGDYLDMPEVMIRSGKLLQLPSPSSTSYAHEMLTFCLDKQVNKLYPLRKEELAALKEAELLFNEYEIAIITADDLQ